MLFAVLISGLRLFLPYAHHYKQDVQNFINHSNNSKIVIGELSMGWEKLGPTLIVKNVSLLETKSTDVFIDQIDVHVDFWQSLLKARLITQEVTLEGVEVLVKNTSLSSNLDESEQNLTERITNIFLDRISRFTLLNSQVVFQTDHIEKTLLISQLNWLNVGERHRAKGYVIVDGLTSNNVKVLLDVTGDELSDFDGQLYLQANQLNITPWLDTVLAIDNEDTHSSINFDGWLTIKKDLPLQLQIALGNNEISWKHNGESQFFSVNHGQVIAQSSREFEQLSVFTSPLSFVTNHNVWNPAFFQLNQSHGALHAFMSNVDIGGMTDVLPLFSSDPALTQLIESINPRGEITHIHAEITNKTPRYYAQIENVSTHEHNGIPGLKNVTGDIAYLQNRINVNLNATAGELDFAEHFIKPIPYHQLSANIDINVDENSWRVSSNNISMDSDELSLSSEISVSKTDDMPTEMSLLTRIKNVDAKYANHYYPHLLMGDSLVDYLNNAIVEGQVKQAQVLFNGPLNKFPFHQNEGIFSVNAELSNSVFKFDESWPAIKAFEANLNFTNNSMLITGRSGFLEGVKVKGVTAEIKDLLDERVLQVNAKFNKTSPHLVTKLMNNSPLVDTVGSTLNQIKVSKPISGDFALTLPLTDTDKAIAKGNVHFSNNNVELQTPNMQFNNVYGKLTYNNQKITTNNVKLNWRGMPLTLSVLADDKELFYDTDINISAFWNYDQWSSQLPIELRGYASGELGWSGLLSLNMFHDGEFAYDLDIESDMGKVALDLPSPYNKPVDMLKSAIAKVSGEKNKTIINASIGDDLKFFGELNHQSVHFDKAHLMLGNDDVLLPTSGFHITTKLDHAKIGEWQPLISSIFSAIEEDELGESDVEFASKAGENSSSPSIISAPARVRGDVRNLSYGDYNFSDVYFDLSSTEQALLLDVNAKELRSQAVFYKDWLEQGIDIKADFVNLTKATVVKPMGESADQQTFNEDESVGAIENNDSHEVYAKLPPIRGICTRCVIDDVDLGQVEFEISRNEQNEIELNKFVASRDKSVINLQGIWSLANGQNVTRIFGDLDIDDLEKETEKLGYEPTIKDSGLKSDFAFDWLGSPHDFSVAGLNGVFNAELDDGYLAEVPDQARVFSVLSLQSLVRKLSFDFRDIFSDGMFYSEITGDFKLKNGIMYTDNMFLKGAAGDLEVKGNTDLGKELLDIRMSYKPNVTSSLPALAWIATLNPVTFLAGIALEEVITSQVYYEMNFELTGSMSQPIFKDVNRKTRNISVGKTTPPKVVDEITTPNLDTQPNKSETKKLDLQLDKLKVDG